MYGSNGDVIKEKQQLNTADLLYLFMYFRLNAINVYAQTSFYDIIQFSLVTSPT
jgi:hypothetical protein